jgi:hypothetical protein
MADNSPPPSPMVYRVDDEEDGATYAAVITASISAVRHQRPTLPSSALNKNLYYQFPTPPNSPPTPSHLPRLASPRSPVLRTRHTRTTSRTSTHTRRQSSLSTTLHIEDFGPPPFPAPSTPLPPTPGAPKVPHTTPAQERSRYSSYQLFDKLLEVERQQNAQDARMKRYSAPPMRKFHRTESTPVARNIFLEVTELLALAGRMRKVKSDQTGVREELVQIRRDPRRDRK